MPDLHIPDSPTGKQRAPHLVHALIAAPKMDSASSEPDKEKLHSNSEGSKSGETICLGLDLILMWGVQGPKAFYWVWKQTNPNLLDPGQF